MPASVQQRRSWVESDESSFQWKVKHTLIDTSDEFLSCFDSQAIGPCLEGRGWNVERALSSLGKEVQLPHSHSHFHSLGRKFGVMGR